MPSELDEATRNLITAAIKLSDSLEWDVTDYGHAVCRCDYDLAGELAMAVTEYCVKLGASSGLTSRKLADKGLADLMRKGRE